MYEKPEVDVSLQYLNHESVPKTENGAIDLTKAERIAEGGTHVLYRFTDAPYVIKVMKDNPNVEALHELEKKYAILYECFDKDGKQRCIREKHTILPVLIPGKEAQNSAISIVPYEPCFTAEIKFDFKIEPAELDFYIMDQYNELLTKVTKTLINNEISAVDFALSDYATLDVRMGDILKRLDSDIKLREVMIEFLTHYRDFYQRTNIILDAMGYENILFFQDEHNEWQFKIGSVIKHDTGKYTQELFAAVRAGKDVDLTGFVNYTHAYFSPANIRAVNVCALKLNLAPVINDVKINAEDLIKVSQKAPIAERVLAYARHGDFVTVEKILQENREEFVFDLGNFWAYSKIEEEYIKHNQPFNALKNYLEMVSELPMILPESKQDSRRMQDAANKISMHKDLTFFKPEPKNKERSLEVELSGPESMGTGLS